MTNCDGNVYEAEKADREKDPGENTDRTVEHNREQQQNAGKKRTYEDPTKLNCYLNRLRHGSMILMIRSSLRKRISVERPILQDGQIRHELNQVIKASRSQSEKELLLHLFVPF